MQHFWLRGHKRNLNSLLSKSLANESTWVKPCGQHGRVKVLLSNYQKMLLMLGTKNPNAQLTCWRSTALTVWGMVAITAVLLRMGSTRLFLVSANGWSMLAKLTRWWWWWWAWLYRWLAWTPRALGTTTRSIGLRLRSLETGELRKSPLGFLRHRDRDMLINLPYTGCAFISGLGIKGTASKYLVKSISKHPSPWITT